MFDAFEEDFQNLAVGRIELVEGMGAELRSSFMGWFDSMPEEGYPFVMFGESEDPAKLRKLTTKPVTEVYEPKEGRVNVIAFKTENGVYEVTRHV